jgi:hypothetical protein
MSRESVKRDRLHRLTGGIDNLQPPSLPFIRVREILGAKLLDSFNGGHHSCLDTGSLNAFLVANDNIAIGKVELVVVLCL